MLSRIFVASNLDVFKKICGIFCAYRAVETRSLWGDLEAFPRVFHGVFEETFVRLISGGLSDLKSWCVLRRSEDVSWLLGRQSWVFFRTPAEISSCFHDIKHCVFKETLPSVPLSVFLTVSVLSSFFAALACSEAVSCCCSSVDLDTRRETDINPVNYRLLPPPSGLCCNTQALKLLTVTLRVCVCVCVCGNICIRVDEYLCASLSPQRFACDLSLPGGTCYTTHTHTHTHTHTPTHTHTHTHTLSTSLIENAFV